MRADDTEYHPAWPNRDFLKPSHMAATRPKTGPLSQVKCLDTPKKNLAGFSGASGPLHLRISSPGLPSPISSCSSESDLEKALAKSLAAAETIHTPMKGFNVSHNPRNVGKHRQDSVQYKRKGRGFINDGRKRHRASKGSRYKTEEQGPLSGKPTKIHKSHRYQPQVQNSRSRGRGVSTSFFNANINHASSESPELSLRLLGDFKHNTYSFNSPGGDKFPPEPNYLAISKDGNELIFASTYDAARLALSKPKPDRFQSAQQQGLEVSVEEEANEASSADAAEGNRIVEADGSDCLLAEAVAIVAAVAGDSRNDKIDDRQVSRHFPIPVDVGGLLTSLRGIFNGRQKSVEVTQIDTNAEQPDVTSDGKRATDNVGQPLIPPHPTRASSAKDIEEAIEGSENTDACQRGMANKRDPEKVARDAPPSSSSHANTLIPDKALGRIYALTDLHPCVLQMFGLEKRWTFRGSLHNRWCRSASGQSGDVPGEWRGGLEEGEIVERVMRLTKPVPQLEPSNNKAQRENLNESGNGKYEIDLASILCPGGVKSTNGMSSDDNDSGLSLHGKLDAGSNLGSAGRHDAVLTSSNVMSNLPGGGEKIPTGSKRARILI
ncbi:hypothetical protein IAT40_001306 [Kwoniella sp. CBS 6097]